uniref:C10 family peptidase n=1 Tax=Alistipes putredinis TaxID=28117 RepID=UPI003FD89F96
MEPVYAVVDEGSLTTEEFRYAVTVTPEQAEADGELVFPLQMVAQAAIGGVDTGGGGNGIVGGPITDIEHWWPEGQQPVGIDYEPWETKEQSGILLKTRWNQTKPYNYLCPIENGKNCFAGCVPVAVAQILVFNALNYNKKFYQIGDQLLNEAMWLNIEEAVTHPQLVKPVVSGESMNAQTWAVAYFINKMGEAVGVKYHSDDGGSPAPTKNVVKLLQYLGDIGLGYSNIALSPITTDKVRDMIFVKKLPFYYSGKSSTNSHAWVLDGWLLRERRVITRYAFLPTQYHTESKEFVHANFGWGGQKDGYYTFNAFYTDRGPVSPQSIEDRDYDHDFSAVTYNLSK